MVDRKPISRHSMPRVIVLNDQGLHCSSGIRGLFHKKPHEANSDKCRGGLLFPFTSLGMNVCLPLPYLPQQRQDTGVAKDIVSNIVQLFQSLAFR